MRSPDFAAFGRAEALTDVGLLRWANGGRVHALLDSALQLTHIGTSPVPAEALDLAQLYTGIGGHGHQCGVGHHLEGRPVQLTRQVVAQPAERAQDGQATPVERAAALDGQEAAS